jgi:phosphatidylglycerophosphatase A
MLRRPDSYRSRNLRIAAGDPAVLSAVRFAVGGNLWYHFHFIGLAIWVAKAAEEILKAQDPGCIVIDEVAGMMVTLAGLPFDVLTVLSGFVVFRILDIIKPFPIRTAERHLSGGTGVVLDDVVAGLMANVLLRVIWTLFGPEVA